MMDTETHPTCAWVCERIEAYLDEALTALESRTIAQHMARCVDCTRELKAAEQTLRLLQDLPMVPCLREADLVQLGQSAPQPRALRLKWESIWRPAAAIATAGALVGLIALYAGSEHPSRRTPNEHDLVTARTDAQLARQWVRQISLETRAVLRHVLLSLPQHSPVGKILRQSLDAPQLPQQGGNHHES